MDPNEKVNIASIDSLLKKGNIRPTAVRSLVYKFLLENDAAKGLSDIENHFVKSDRTTLYRTIKTFEDKGIVHQIDDGTGTAKYALCEEGCNCEIETDLHLHFHCNACDKTICLTDHKIPEINLPTGYTAENANLVIKGICDKCT